MSDSFDGVEGNTQVHHASHAAERDFETDQDDDFIGRNDLHELRVALDAFHGKLEFHYVGPGFFQLVQKEIRDARHETQFDLCQRPSFDGSRFRSASQEAIDDREENLRVDIENQVAVERIGL